MKLRIRKNFARIGVVKMHNKEKKRLELFQFAGITLTLYYKHPSPKWKFLAGHFIDENRLLQERILNFYCVPNPKIL